MTRIAQTCGQDRSLMASLIVWNMLVTGAPTIYYGTEAEFSEQRLSLWNKNIVLSYLSLSFYIYIYI